MLHLPSESPAFLSSPFMSARDFGVAPISRRMFIRCGVRYSALVTSWPSPSSTACWIRFAIVQPRPRAPRPHASPDHTQPPPGHTHEPGWSLLAFHFSRLNLLKMPFNATSLQSSDSVIYRPCPILFP